MHQNRFAESVANMGAKARIGAGIAGAAIGNFVAGGIQKFMDFDRGMREVWTLLPNLSERGFKEMGQQVLAFSKEFGRLPNEVIPALYQAISAGIPKDNVFEFMATAQKAAIAGVANIEDSVRLLSSVINAYGLDVSEAERVSDAMFTAVRLGVTTFPELAASMARVTPIASVMGVAVEDVASAITSVTKQGTDTASAVTGIQATFVALQRSSTPLSDALREAGYASSQAAIDALGFQGTLELVRKASDDTGVPLVKMVGRIDAARTILQLTGEKAQGAREDLDAFADTSGATAGAFEKMAGSVDQKAREVATAVHVMAIGIGEKLQALGPLMYAFGPTLARGLGSAFGFAFGTVGVNIVKYITTAIWPPMITTVTSLGTAAGAAQGTAYEQAAAGPNMLRKLLLRMAGLQIPMVAAGTTLGTVVGGAISAAIAIASNPIAWVVAIVAGLVLLAGNKELRDKAVAIGQSIIGWIADALKAVPKLLHEAGKWIVDAIVEGIGGTGATLKEAGKWIADSVAGALDDLGARLAGQVSESVREGLQISRTELPALTRQFGADFESRMGEVFKPTNLVDDLVNLYHSLGGDAVNGYVAGTTAQAHARANDVGIVITDMFDRDVDVSRAAARTMDSVVTAMEEYVADNGGTFGALWDKVLGPDFAGTSTDVASAWEGYLNKELLGTIREWFYENEGVDKAAWMTLLTPGMTYSELQAAWTEYLAAAQLNVPLEEAAAAMDLIVSGIPDDLASYLAGGAQTLEDGTVAMIAPAEQALLEWATKLGTLEIAEIPRDIANAWISGGKELPLAVQAMFSGVRLSAEETLLAEFYQALNMPTEVAMGWAQQAPDMARVATWVFSQPADSIEAVLADSILKSQGYTDEQISIWRNGAPAAGAAGAVFGEALADGVVTPMEQALVDAHEIGSRVPGQLGRGMMDESRQVLSSIETLRDILENGLTPKAQAMEVIGAKYIKDVAKGMRSEIPGAKETAIEIALASINTIEDAGLTGAKGKKGMKAIGEYYTILMASGMSEGERRAALAGAGVSEATIDSLMGPAPKAGAAGADYVDRFRQAIVNGQGSIRTAAEQAAENAKNPLVSLSNNSYAWGAALMNQYRLGLVSQAQAIRTAILNTTSGFATYLKTKSPPGPLSPMHGIRSWGFNTMAEYAKGIMDAHGLVNEAMLGAMNGPADLLRGGDHSFSAVGGQQFEAVVKVRLEDPDGIAQKIGYSADRASSDVQVGAKEFVRSLRHRVAVSSTG